MSNESCTFTTFGFLLAKNHNVIVNLSYDEIHRVNGVLITVFEDYTIQGGYYEKVPVYPITDGAVCRKSSS